MTSTLIARVLGLDELYVMGSIVNTADEGAHCALQPDRGDKDMLLAYVPASPGLMQPSAGYNFSWTGLANSGGIGTSTSVSRFRMDHLRADRLEIQSSWDYKVVSSALGYFFELRRLTLRVVPTQHPNSPPGFVLLSGRAVARLC